ncbi:MAG: phage holin family protein, partial [Betaproteobacteria bacterium]|nr:phage holin family protein [Betaproteobacteria bacterium]
MSEPRRTGLFASLKGLLGTSLTLLQTRLQLLATELEEERQRLLALLLWGAVAVLALGAGAIFLAIFLTVLLWDSQRLLV